MSLIWKEFNGFSQHTAKSGHLRWDVTFDNKTREWSLLVINSKSKTSKRIKAKSCCHGKLMAESDWKSKQNQNLPSTNSSPKPSATATFSNSKRKTEQ